MNTQRKDKPTYWRRKLANMRRAKALRGPNMIQRERREEELWRRGITHPA